ARRHRRRRPVGGRGVRAPSRRAPAGRRLAGRSARPASHLCERDRALRRGVQRLRAGARCAAARDRARGAGRGCGAPRAGQPRLVLALAGGGGALVAFGALEARSHSPMVPLAIFRSRRFTGANLLTLLLYGALGGAFFFLPLDLIQAQRYSATAAGAASLPFVLVLFLL